MNVILKIIAKNPPMAFIGLGGVFGLTQATFPNEVTAWWGWLIIGGFLLQIIWLIKK